MASHDRGDFDTMNKKLIRFHKKQLKNWHLADAKVYNSKGELIREYDSKGNLIKRRRK